MGDNDVSTTVVQLGNQSITRKSRAHSPGPSIGKNSSDDCRLNRTATEINRPSGKLPNLLPKATVFSSSSDSIQLKRYRSQLSKDFFNSTSTKFERPATNMNGQSRLPTLYALTSEGDQKRIAEARRKQIYALNHLMRELEQEQFHEFCKSHNIGTNNSEVTVNSNEDIKKD
ncbi:unnamed protein product [Rotaria socialis]|uniref:Small vasohibin-binding protein n=1 Tax=Rotaria socialis TaxID=392032 RepID=A0A817XYB3_9BILA|nr:unnamed protein product [Rotaria socialis]CAF4885902.1 unnamed protein product [Rotaria socialis]